MTERTERSGIAPASAGVSALWRGRLLARPKMLVLSLLFAVLTCCSSSSAQYTATSLAELRAYSNLSNATVTLAPGDYWINGDHIANPTASEPIFLELSGNNNTYNLSNANLKLDTRKLDGFGRALGHGSGVRVVKITGSDNTVNGLSLTGYDLDLDTDPNAQRHADWATVYVQLTGDDNTMQGVDVVTRGSSPYGLGDAFGKGASGGVTPFVGHRKASAFNVYQATNAVVDDMHLDVNTFGHGFFVQEATNTTLTNSTVTGELFPSSNVINHPSYQQYGHTFWGNPIQEGIMISGAEAGVRMYTGSSGLTVKDVVVTNMRSAFNTALGSGTKILENVEAYGAETGFGIRSGTTIINGKGDIVNGPLVTSDRATSSTIVDVELVGSVPVGVDWAVANVNGSNANISITSDLPASALPEGSLIRFGQADFQNWRNRDSPTSFEDGADPLTNTTFSNDTNQMVMLGADVTGLTGSSQAPVITNGKSNAYDGISIVLAGNRTVLTSTQGLGNNGNAMDGTLDTNASIVEAGATLEIQPGLRISNEKLTIAGNGLDGKGALYSDGSNNSDTRFGSSNSGDESTIFLNGDSSIGVGVAGNQLLVGRIQGTGNLTKLGPGRLTMGKSSTYAGDLTIAEGHVTARPGVVHMDLAVAVATSISGIGNHAFDTLGDVNLGGTLDLNGRTDDNSLDGKIGRLFGSGNVVSSNPAVTDSNNLTIAGTSGQGTFSGGIQGKISLVKSGASTQILSGSLAHTGATTINGGTLVIDGSHTGGGAYTIENGGTLGGNGSIASTVVVESGGVLAPGTSAGQFTIDTVQMQANSTLEIEIGGPTAGTDHDFLVANDIVLGGDLAISLLPNSGGDVFAPYATDTFTVVSASSLSGAFNNVANGTRLDTAGSEGSFVVDYDSATKVLRLTNFLPAGLLGDYDANGVVDAADFTLWRDSMGQTGLTPFSGADGTGDGLITSDDYLVWSSNFGAVATNAAVSVPEPAALTLLLLGLLVFPRRRKN